MESLEGRVLLAEMAAWMGQTNTDLVGRDGRNPDGYQDIDIRLLGLDPTRSVSRVDVQRAGGGLWAATTSLSSNAVLVRSQDQTTGAWANQADLYLEPYFNDPTNTKYELIRITYSDNTSAVIRDLYSTSPVDNNLRVQGDELGVSWVGQDGLDLTGPGVAVGPDGIQDLHLKLSNLLMYQRSSDGSINRFDPDQDTVIVSMPRLDGTTVTWIAGPRPATVPLPYNFAEIFLDPSDPSHADLYLSPVADLAVGGTVTVNVSYKGIDKKDVSPKPGASASQLVATIDTTPNLSLAAPAPQGPSLPVSFDGPSASWAGQEGVGSATAGYVHVTLSGLPVGWAIASATLSNNAGQAWTPGNANPAWALLIRPQADPTKADVLFPPARDESDALMTLRFSLVGGSIQYVSQFHGGSADPKLRDPAPSAATITVDPAYVSQPGQDLNTLVRQYGTIHLRAGTYVLSKPLDLVNSVRLLAEPGTVFLFSQASSDPAWSFAIKVRKSHTTIDGTAPGGLAIRFATPIRWTNEFQMNPAVIGSSYSDWNFGPNPKVDLNFRNLDIDYSPPLGSGDGYNFTNVRLIQSNGDDSGVIANNTLRGGGVEVWGGPWTIANNDYRGAAAGSSVSPVFAVRNGHDVTVEGNHAHQDDRSGITYSFLLFTGASNNTIVRNNVVDGGIGRDAAVTPGGRYNFPELILTESYYPHYEGLAQVSSTSRRLLQVSNLRGGAGVPGDVVSILSGPFAGRWFRIAQGIDSQNYLLDGDLPAGSYAISITRGFVNELFEGNTIDTSSLARSSSVAFQLGGTHVGAVLRNNLVVGAKPFFISSGPNQNSLGGTTSYPAPWGWSHLPVLDLTIQGNTFRDPVFWVPDFSATGATRTVAAATLTVEHGGLVRENQGRLYLTASITDNTFVYSEAFLANSTGNIVALQVGDARSIDPAELNLTKLSGNTVIAPAAFGQAGRIATIQFDSGNVAGKAVSPALSLPAPSNAPSQLTAKTLNQDGSDFVGWSPTPGPNGFQDVHIVLSGLRTDIGIRTVDVYPYGAGHGQYAAPGLAPGTPGLDPGAWRVGLVQQQTGPVRFSSTADIYMQPFMVEGGRSHWDVRVTYLDGSIGVVSVFGVVADPNLKVGDSPSRITVVSLGQDNSDFVGTSSTARPDGYQDLHFALAGLPTNKAIAQVDVSPYGYGRYQYVSPLAPPLPSPHPGILDRDAGNWRAVVFQAALGGGQYATTADLYVPSVVAENGIQPGTNSANHYDIQITFTDGSTITVAAWGIVGDPKAKVVDLVVQSFGQDGSDFVGPAATRQSDGVPDLHLVLSGLRIDQAISQVEVWGDGGGEWTYQGTTFRSAAHLIRGTTSNGAFTGTADLYLAPDASFVGADGRLRPQTLKIVVRYADGTTSRQAIIPGVSADPNLQKPVLTSWGQDGHDLARLAPTSGSDGQQDVHLTLSNLPSNLPVARVVVRRQGGGATYQSNGSNGSWVAVTVQDQFGPASYATTADIYFEPATGLNDVNQPYVVEIYLGDASRLSYTLTTTVSARAGLAVVAEPTFALLQSAPMTAELEVAPSPATAPLAATANPPTQTRLSTPEPGPSVPSADTDTLVVTGPISAHVAEARLLPGGPLSRLRVQRNPRAESPHGVSSLGVSPKRTAFAKTWFRRHARRQTPG